MAHLEAGDLGKPPGPSARPRDEPGEAGAAPAPAPAGAGRPRAERCFTHRRGHADDKCGRCDGCRGGRRRLCRPPLGLSESMEFITLRLFPLSEEQLFVGAALQIRSQPLAGAGSRHRDLFGQRWEEKPLAQPPASQLTATRGRRWIRAGGFSELSSEGKAAAEFHSPAS